MSAPLSASSKDKAGRITANITKLAMSYHAELNPSNPDENVGQPIDLVS
jgi:hypothetical protein